MSPQLQVSGLALRLPELELGPLELAVDAGEGLLVYGPARAGKTPLLKALVGLVPATGTVRVGAVAVRLGQPLQLDALRAQVGMVFQNDALFDALTVRENVALPLRRSTSQDADIRITSALTEVGLQDAAEKLPEQLSGGMRKRAGLARALVMKPRLLLVDEPLAGLDPGNQLRVVRLLAGAMRAGAALVVAVADPTPLWQVCTHALALEAGTILARGPTAQVRAQSAPLLGRP